MAITCDRCGREMNDRWEIEGMPGVGGNCTCCGDDLCAECAGDWNDDGDECMQCSKEEGIMIYGTFIEAVEEFSREITFLSRAVSNDESRYFLCHILIEPSVIEPGKFCGVSTDGKRLHIIDPLSAPKGIGLTAGNWRPLKMGGRYSWIAQKISDCGRFPAFRYAIPKDEPLFTFKLPGLPRGNLTRNMPFIVDFFRKFPDPTAINMNYLNALDHFRAWEVKWYGSDKAVLFESGIYTAVIMPMEMRGLNERR